MRDLRIPLAILAVLFLAAMAFFRPSIVSFVALLADVPPPPPDVPGSTTSTTVALSTVSVSRTMPSSVVAGDEIGVVLSVIKGDNPPAAITINEHVPVGWGVVRSSPTYNVYTPEGGEIKWLLFGSGFYTRNVTYTLRVPDGSHGSAEIAGECLYKYPDSGAETTEDISGDSYVDVSGAEEISDFELLGFIGQWAGGEVDDFDLLEFVEAWSSD